MGIWNCILSFCETFKFFFQNPCCLNIHRAFHPLRSSHYHILTDASWYSLYTNHPSMPTTFYFLFLFFHIYCPLMNNMTKLSDVTMVTQYRNVVSIVNLALLLSLNIH
ncbi:hypothetical protein EB796_000745 [Bugula neritina]|uniref:Uncharacterized protein n=1 Tax=Bugula neritina TaxID=10212 RepID=A0A7J7KRV3_BUGNE|nr:hypothetical protein EB796_000745 [Bugula neritina]